MKKNEMLMATAFLTVIIRRTANLETSKTVIMFLIVYFTYYIKKKLYM